MWNRISAARALACAACFFVGLAPEGRAEEAEGKSAAKSCADALSLFGFAEAPEISDEGQRVKITELEERLDSLRGEQARLLELSRLESAGAEGRLPGCGPKCFQFRTEAEGLNVEIGLLQNELNRLRQGPIQSAIKARRASLDQIRLRLEFAYKELELQESQVARAGRP